MGRVNNTNEVDEIYNKALEEKMGKFIQINLDIPGKVFEEFTYFAVANGHLNINSALIELIRDAIKPKKNKKSIPK